MPFWALHKLADDLGDPPENVDIIGIGMSARSGSTLLTQMFNRVPRTVAMSEPWALVHIHEWFNRGIISKGEYTKLLRSLLRVQFKPIHNVSVIIYSISKHLI